MSYDISLRDPVTHEVIDLDSPHMMHGGMYALGGTTSAWLNVTYNYAPWYYIDGVFPKKQGENKGILAIYGLTGAESIPILEGAINALSARDDDISDEERKECKQSGATGYWMPTRKNAIKPLYQLLAFAKMRPDGVWDGD